MGGWVAARIADRLRRHVPAPVVERVCDAVMRGQVVHLPADTDPDHATVVAFKRGVLFVAGREYVIDGDE